MLYNDSSVFVLVVTVVLYSDTPFSLSKDYASNWPKAMVVRCGGDSEVSRKPASPKTFPCLFACMSSLKD